MISISTDERFNTDQLFKILDVTDEISIFPATGSQMIVEFNERVELFPHHCKLKYQYDTTLEVLCVDEYDAPICKISVKKYSDTLYIEG